MIQTQVELKLQALRSNNGGEYVSEEMDTIMSECGIVSSPTAPYNPHQNGVAERLTRNLCDLIRSMLSHRELPNAFWAEVLAVAVHISNRVISPGIA